jgi:hypothetical protein
MRERKKLTCHLSKRNSFSEYQQKRFKIEPVKGTRCSYVLFSPSMLKGCILALENEKSSKRKRVLVKIIIP